MSLPVHHAHSPASHIQDAPFTLKYSTPIKELNKWLYDSSTVRA